jgi:hypothetical protein
MRHSADINRKVRNIRCRHSHHDAAGGLCIKQIEFLTIPLLRFLRVRQQTRGNFLFEICTRQHALASQSLSFQGFLRGAGGDSSTEEQRTLTPLILVRIQVSQPGILLKSLRICSFLASGDYQRDHRRADTVADQQTRSWRRYIAREVGETLVAGRL